MNYNLLQKLKNKRKKIISDNLGTKDKMILKVLRNIGIINGISDNTIRRNTRINIKKIEKKEYYIKKERKKQWMERNKYNDIYIIKNNKKKYNNKVTLTGGKMKIRIKV